MWFGKNIIAQLGLALALAVPAFAAPVEPLQFENISGEQQEYWNFLTKFKLWGTNGITTGRLKLPDSSGWTGCAKGGFVGHNDGLELGGPIVIGGDIDFSNMDKFKFLSGPVRTTGDFSAGNDNGGHFFAGAICVEGGDVNPPVETGINRANGNSSLATLQLGKTAATQGICAYNKVSEVRTDLAVPVLTGSPSYGSFVHVFGGWDNPVFIDVPPQNAGDPEVYDLYLTSIVFENDSRLVVRMPEKGRLTRIFLQGELKFGTHPEILIQYMGKGSEYSGGHYTKIVNPKDIDIDTYFGNLMIYTHEPIKFSETDDHPILGTFDSTQNISIVSNMKFAGQIIGNSLTIGDEIDGSGFHYMPFDPDTLKIPEALSGGKYPENDDDALVPITLDSKAKVAVSFKYCFDLSTTNHREGVKYTDINDFKKTTLSTFPVCGQGFETISIAEGKTESDKKIYIHAVDDKILEKDEILLLKIFDLTGAVMPNSTSDNEFELTITDASFAKFNNKDKDPYKVKENTPNTVLKDDDIVKVINLKDFTWENVDELRLEMEDFTAVGTGSHSVNDLFNFYLDKDEDNKMVYAVISVKDASLFDYETLTPLDYKVILTLKDQNGVVGCNQDTIIRTLSVVDVNEPPTVDDPTFTIPENLGKNKLVGEVEGKDPDSLNGHGYEHLEYYIDPTNPVANAAFKIATPTSGKITVKDPALLDYETVPGHKFEFDVLVRNCEYDATKKTYTANCLDDVISQVTVELTDEPEPPEIIPKCQGDECPSICQGDKCEVCQGESCNEVCVENCDKPHDPIDVLTVSVKENSKKNYEVMRYLVRDEDYNVGHNKDLTAAIEGSTVAEKIFGAKMVKDANGNWNVVVFVADSIELDYEKLDSDRLNVTIYVYDPDDGGLYGSLPRVIQVVDVNEPPTVDNPTFTIPENYGNDKVVGEVVGKDPDSLNQHGFEHLEYFIDPANTVANAAFKIVDPTKGNIAVKDSTKLDYETVPGHKFEFDVLVRNCEYDATKKTYTANCLEDVVSHVTVELTDEGEPPIIIPICEGDECPTICQGDKCVECKDESCHEECVENCDKPNDSVDVLTVSVNENSRQNYEIMRYLVRDEDFGVGHTMALTAEIKNTTVNTGAEDLFGAKMEKDADGNWNVVVYVADSSKLDYETLDFYTHDVTINVRDPKDAEGVHGSLLRVIKVEDVNEAPIADDAKFEPDENLPDSAIVGELKVAEPDTKHVPEFGHLEYSIIGKDETFVFAMDSNRVIVNDSSKMDYELPVHFYTFDVLIANCELNKTSGKYDVACLYDTAKVTVDIQDVNEKPEIIIDGPTPDGGDDSEPFCVAHCDTTDRGVWKDSILTVGVKENTDDSLLSKTGMVLFQYHYADEDTGHVAGAKVTWFDAGSTISSVSTKGSDLFNIVGKNGVITVTVNDQKLLDYEKLRNATSRDDPDPEYTMGIVVTDPKGLADTLYRTIRVIDVNEKPLYTAEPCVVVEGNHPGDSIGHVEHPSDIDSLSRNPALYDNDFKMTGGDTTRFELRKDSTDLMRVMLAALDSIDCEDGTYTCGVDSVYWVELTYGDTTLKTVYNNIKIPVKVLDRNENPIIKTDTIGVDENSPKGTDVGIIDWFDYDRFDSVMHFEITKDPSGCFAIDEKTGAVTVKKDKCEALDHEKNKTLEIEVAVTDMVAVTDTSLIYGGPNMVKKTIKVNVHDVNEPPHLDDTTFTVSEFKKPGTVIDTVVGHDPDTKNPEYSKLTYSMVKGDSTKFKVNPTTGEIVLLDSLDYETKNEYKIDVRVYDGEYDDVATITIKVKNEIEKTHVRITMVDDSAKVWNDPEVIYTNNPGREICWEQERDTVCQDIHITKDTVVTIKYKNPKKDSAGVDKVIIYYSNAAPMVTISAKPTQVSADNIFTILEKTGDDDSTVYVNDVKNNIYITIRDTANKNTKVDTSFKMPISLETVKIENKVYDKVESIIKAGVYLDETKPSKEVTRVPTNGNTVKVSYKEAVGKDTVTVTYETDKKGDVVKSKVIGDDGKEHSWEVITVSYVTKVKINGKEENVTISYLADAATGQVLEQDAEGNLMTATAAEAKRKEAKKNAAKADSTKNKNESTVSDFSTGRFSIAYSYTVKQYVAGELMESSVDVSYVVDGKGELTKNADGDRGYSVKYTYTNIFGNAAEQSLFIVLDQVLPTVEIRSPVDYQEIRSNYVNVEWYVNGKVQDTLTVQGLEKGVNMIVRFYRDKAGNEASDTVFVVMKDSKDIELSVVNPVTEINPDKVAEFYSGDNAKFAPEKGQTYSVSILSTSGKEIETLKGGSFDAKASSGEELYPDQKQKHLGPTLGLKVQLPVVKPDNKSGTVSGLATMDDLMCHGKINLEEVCNENTKTMGVEEYVAKYCDADVSASDDLSSINLYNSRITVKIWIYTSLGGFVDYYRFSHDLNEPDYTNEAGLLQMFFELKPDKEGFVRSESGKLYSTGAYLYKVQASVNSVPRCDVMPMKASSHKRGEKIKSSDDLLKPFGYKRPKQK